MLCHKFTTKKYEILPVLTDLMCPRGNIIARCCKSLMIVSNTEPTEIYATGKNDHYRLGTRATRASPTIPLHIEVFREIAVISQSRGTDSYDHEYTIIYTKDHHLLVSGKTDIGAKDHPKNSGRMQKDPPDRVLQKIDLSWLKLVKGELDPIIDIKCSYKGALFLTKSGKVYGCGDSKVSNMGHYKIPIRLKFGKNNEGKYIKIRKIAMCTFGEPHPMIFVTSNGMLLIKQELHFEAKRVCFGDKKIKIRDIDAGSYHFAAISRDNICYTFGNNECGQCGYDDDSKPQVMFTYYLTPAYDKPYELKECKNVDSVSCGNKHTVILTKDNKIYTMGANGSRQCSSLDNARNIYNFPHLFSKQKELGMSENSVCEWVLGLYNATLIAIGS